MRTDAALVQGAKARLIACGLEAARVHVDYGEPTQDDKLPLIDIFVPASDDTARGDPRSGLAEYTNSTMLVVSINAKANSAAPLKQWLASAGEQVLDALLSDRDWATVDGATFIEGYGNVRRIYELPPKGAYVLGKLQLQIHVLHSATFGPGASTLPDLRTLSAGVDLTGDGAPDLTVAYTLPTS